MADAHSDFSPEYVRRLFDGLQAGTLTLQQCYELQRWIEATYLASHQPFNDKRLPALVYLHAIQSRLIDLQLPTPPAHPPTPRMDDRPPRLESPA
jgi:hypothetical protein